MTDTEFANLVKGQKLYQPSSLNYGAYISEVVFEGRTKTGKAKVQAAKNAGLAWHPTDRELVTHYFVSKRDAAEVLVNRAESAAEQARKNLKAARALLSETK